MHRIQNKEMIFICFTQNGALKLEKIKILCYNIFDGIRIEILKYQDRITRQNKTDKLLKPKLSTGGNRQ